MTTRCLIGAAVLSCAKAGAGTITGPIAVSTTNARESKRRIVRAPSQKVELRRSQLYARASYTRISKRLKKSELQMKTALGAGSGQCPTVVFFANFAEVLCVPCG